MQLKYLKCIKTSENNYKQSHLQLFLNAEDCLLVIVNRCCLPLAFVPKLSMAR